MINLDFKVGDIIISSYSRGSIGRSADKRALPIGRARELLCLRVF